MKHRNSILILTLLFLIGLVTSGCGCSGGECPFKKIFGKSSQTSQTEAPAESGTK